MKAILMDDFGGPEVLYLGDAPEPVAGPGEIVIDIHATSVNPADYKSREGGYGRDRSKVSFPYILGRDCSGVVREIGDGVTDLAVGDAVFAVLDAGHEGTYAEAVALKASLAAKKPDSLSHIEATSLGVAAITALIGIEDTAKMQPGQKLLMHAGAGGVGGFAIQIARKNGVHVVATASARNNDYVMSLGANEVVDYTKVDFADAVSD